MGCAVMITSGKGGTGKTSLTAGVASCLAALGQRVLCIDMDIGLRNLDLVLGLSDRAVMDFSDVMAYRCPLLSAAVEQPEIKGLFLLTAPLDGDGLEGQRFREVVEEAKDTFDYVFMDSPAGLGVGFQLARAKEICGPKGVPVDVIPMQDYGMCNGMNVLKFAYKLAKNK